MPLIYACIAPHAGDLIDESNKITLTRQFMIQMGQRLQGLAPEIIVIINPHGFRVQEALSMSVPQPIGRLM
jgi:aromatic ring-opening dioxygenase LigB subunit